MNKSQYIYIYIVIYVSKQYIYMFVYILFIFCTGGNKVHVNLLGIFFPNMRGFLACDAQVSDANADACAIAT